MKRLQVAYVHDTGLMTFGYIGAGGYLFFSVPVPMGRPGDFLVVQLLSTVSFLMVAPCTAGGIYWDAGDGRWKAGIQVQNLSGTPTNEADNGFRILGIRPSSAAHPCY